VGVAVLAGGVFAFIANVAQVGGFGLDVWDRSSARDQPNIVSTPTTGQPPESSAPAAAVINLQSFSARTVESTDAVVSYLGEDLVKYPTRTEVPAIDLLFTNDGERAGVVTSIRVTFRPGPPLDFCIPVGSDVGVSGEYEVQVPEEIQADGETVEFDVAFEVTPDDDVERLRLTLGGGPALIQLYTAAVDYRTNTSDGWVRAGEAQFAGSHEAVNDLVDRALMDPEIFQSATEMTSGCRERNRKVIEDFAAAEPQDSFDLELLRSFYQDASERTAGDRTLEVAELIYEEGSEERSRSDNSLLAMLTALPDTPQGIIGCPAPVADVPGAGVPIDCQWLVHLDLDGNGNQDVLTLWNQFGTRWGALAVLNGSHVSTLRACLNWFGRLRW
jgi:hypothetical protein